MKKNLRIYILAFIFALALWLYINLNLSYSLYVSIPIDVKSGRSQALIEEIPGAIDVKVKGKGWDLLNLIISKGLRYNLDISKLKKDTRIITKEYVTEGMNLQPNVSVIEINPDTINIKFDKVFEKLVPVKNNIRLNLKEGYDIIGSPVLTPDSVEIQGASYIVNRLMYIPTDVKIINNVNTDVSGVVSIKDTLQNLIKINRQQINFSYKVQLSAEKNFEEVFVNVINVPDDKEVLLIPPKLSASLRGGVEQLTQISSSDIKVEIEFSKIESDTLGYIVPEIIIPDGTNLLKAEPQKLQYIIKNKQ